MIKYYLLIILCCSSLHAQDSTNKTKENFAWQIALEAKMYSTGLLDGVWGPKSDKALKEYLTSEGLGDIISPKKSEEVINLLQVDFENVYTTYVITEEDAQQIVEIPVDWNERAKLPKMGYEAIYEVVQGKFRCSKKALIRLNPAIAPENYKPGVSLVVPLVKEPSKRKMVRLEIDLNEKTISGFDANNKKIMFIYCSVAQSKERLPKRNAVVANKSLNPNYTFNPKYWPEVNNVKQILIIKPGPKNPVGSAWMGLDLPGYGIHGTPIPDNIGKTGSHGCFRLTNWHAVHLLGCVEIGTPVIMVGINQGEAPVKNENISDAVSISDNEKENQLGNTQIVTPPTKTEPGSAE